MKLMSEWISRCRRFIRSKLHPPPAKFQNKRDLINLINQTGDITKGADGKSRKHYLPSEKVARQNARRSLVATRAIGEGKVLQRGDIAIKRPGTGIPPAMLEHVVGARTLADIEKDEVLAYRLLRLE
jgi:sialic acid synthase SpsE